MNLFFFFGSCWVISIDMALFPVNLLSPHCNTWLTTLVGVWCPEHVLLMSGRMLLSWPLKTGARTRISIPKGPSDLMNLPFGCLFPPSHKWTQPYKQRAASNKAVNQKSLNFSTKILKTPQWNSKVKAQQLKKQSCSDFYLISPKEVGEGGGQAGALVSSFLTCFWFVIMDRLNHCSPVSAWRVQALWCGGTFHMIQYLGG